MSTALKVRKGTFKHIEEYLMNYEALKKEIEELRELQRLSEKGLLPLESKGYAYTSGIPIYKTPIDAQEAEFLAKFIADPHEMTETFGVPCRNHIVNAEFCGAFFIHISKCQQGDCPLFEVGMPRESHKFQRISEYWLYNFSEIEKEISMYLKNKEIPPANLLKLARDALQMMGNPKEYLKKKEETNERKPIPVSIRFKVLQRDNFTCVYCGRSPKDDGVKLHVDHVLAYSKGGEDELDNLVAACQDCNLGKSDKSLTCEVYGA